MVTHPEIPRHIAIIMDGNGRWAKERGLPRLEGHRVGAESVQEVLEASIQLGVEYLTLYAFSSENWSRPATEVSALMGLLNRFLENKAKELDRQNVRLIAIGQVDRLPEKTRVLIERIEARTANHTTLTLVLALSYGGREEIVEAARSLASDAAAGNISASDIDAELFASRLQTSGIPDPDLLIRTSGEMRVSNFLLWQISYAEIVIVKKYWPDFRHGDLLDSVEEYKRRHRRFGSL
ncbi:MAG: isoprenyl transferase [Akkermansiaceae bacterium]|jgi:undecaprenyl diphosphate synthase|nr:isoprenyl transferase [Akkermansiaceae bacterium]MBJ7285471.1 isoprenyl transferase [Akkermansiaceae bacterium]MBJ7396414.1 isoprenyl transferase [Akkermansiaceae bacterium]MBJ7424283.1 isoprenyl transferase [Akkermansiaceae bacterium]